MSETINGQTLSTTQDARPRYTGERMRKFYLHKPPRRNDWHIRFTPPGNRRRTTRGLPQRRARKRLEPPKRIAVDIIKSFWIDSGRSAVRLKLRDANATIGELIAKYKQRAAQRPGTIRSNVRSLRMGIKDCLENTRNDHYSTTEANRGCHYPCG